MQCNGDDRAQWFELTESGRIRHKPTGQCLSGTGVGNMPSLVDCDSLPNSNLLWEFMLP